MSLDIFALLDHLEKRHDYTPNGTIRILDAEYIKLMSWHAVAHKNAYDWGHTHERLGRAVSYVVEEVTEPTIERRSDSSQGRL